jgi:hypothetical protein
MIFMEVKADSNPADFYKKKIVSIPCNTFSAERVQVLVCSLSCDSG